MNALQIAPISGLTAPVSSGGHSPAGEASSLGHSQAPAVAPPPPPPPPPADATRFDRQTGFVPGTNKVYVDLVDPEIKDVSYRLFGPPANAADAYTRGGSEPASKDLAVV
jgi:hypothetical protein